MPTPLPAAGDTLLTPPDRAEVERVWRGACAAVSDSTGRLAPLQSLLLGALFTAMTGHAVPTDPPPPETRLSAVELGEALARRHLAFRTRIVQVMLLTALVVHPMPPELGRKLREYAAELYVDDDMIGVAEAYASGALDLAAADFDRNGYLANHDPERINALHASALAQPWETVESDPALASAWASLEELPPGTLGRGVVDFYRDRGFVYPGLPGSAPPLLAQHDWVHVLADYGTTLEGEVEVFGFIARANDDPHAFSLLAMIVCLFETGTLPHGAGLFDADPGHLEGDGMPARLADAMRRGALVEGSRDFMALDWFTIADRPLSVVRRELALPPKAPAAVAAGSAGPWQSGGITDYQLQSARAAAAAAGRPYVPWRPAPEHGE